MSETNSTHRKNINFYNEQIRNHQITPQHVFQSSSHNLPEFFVPREDG